MNEVDKELLKIIFWMSMMAANVLVILLHIFIPITWTIMIPIISGHICYLEAYWHYKRLLELTS
jgi:hypothetical protein